MCCMQSDRKNNSIVPIGLTAFWAHTSLNKHSFRGTRWNWRRVVLGVNEKLSFVKIPLISNAHPLQVDPGVGFLCTLEGCRFVRGLPFPDNPLVGSRPVLSGRARNGFDVAAD